ncbi:TolC family protein [Portibacter lacus]|nr:TolC family protein [Portibacter lacus]
MRKMIKYTFVVLFFLSMFLNFHAEAQSNIDLEEVLRIARKSTFASTNADQQKQIAKQDYAIFKSSLKPALFLDGKIPGFFSSSSAITQPNGTIEFQRVSQNNASLSLFAQQSIPLTGATLFVQSNIQRFDDFTFNNRLYNGVPLRIGISQPIFGFNQMKWNKQLAPVTLKEANVQYTFDIENTQFQANFLYFQVLIAEEDRKISKLNTEVNERLIKIAEERLELGKISKDEKLQLEIELENAKVNLRSADYQLQAAERNLWTFLSEKAGPGLSYSIPDPMSEILIDEDKAVEMAMKNRPEIISYQRQLLEAERNIAQVKAATGPQANLFASFGLARGAESVSEIYRGPFTEQQLSLTFSVPIVDWGKRKSSRMQAQIVHENTLASIKQETAEMENSVRLKVREFSMLQRAVKDQEAIRTLAEKRFNIANERYVLGAISITDWTLAQREKDQTRRNYIQTLSNYWNSYYALRLMTGFDFANNQKITY